MTISFYELVRVVDSGVTRDLGIGSKLGVVVGLPPHMLDLEDEPRLDGTEGHFAVEVQGTTYALARGDFVPTGEVLSAEEFQSGEHRAAALEDSGRDAPDLELEVLDEVVARHWGELSGSAVLDEAGRLLGAELSGNALMWFALRRESGLRLARALVRARYLVPDAAAVDSAMHEILGGVDN